MESNLQVYFWLIILYKRIFLRCKFLQTKGMRSVEKHLNQCKSTADASFRSSFLHTLSWFLWYIYIYIYIYICSCELLSKLGPTHQQNGHRFCGGLSKLILLFQNIVFRVKILRATLQHITPSPNVSQLNQLLRTDHSVGCYLNLIY